MWSGRGQQRAFKDLAARHRILEKRIEALEDKGISLPPDMLLQRRVRSLHRDHRLLLEYNVHSPSRAALLVKDEIGHRAYNFARQTHRCAGKERHNVYNASSSADLFLHDADSGAGLPGLEVVVKNTFFEVVDAPLTPLAHTRSHSAPPESFGSVSVPVLGSPLVVELDAQDEGDYENEYFGSLEALVQEHRVGVEVSDQSSVDYVHCPEVDPFAALEAVHAVAVSLLCAQVQAFLSRSRGESVSMDVDDAACLSNRLGFLDTWRQHHAAILAQQRLSYQSLSLYVWEKFGVAFDCEWFQTFVSAAPPPLPEQSLSAEERLELYGHAMKYKIGMGKGWQDR
jgi:hypothetical protein